MPRKPRFVLPGVPQHVIQRGHNREPYFYSPENWYLTRVFYMNNKPLAMLVYRPDSGENFLHADMDNDGSISVEDYLVWYFNLYNQGDVSGDVTGDGALTMDDASLVVSCALNQDSCAAASYASSLFYIHTDHLGTPKMLSNASGTPVWRAVARPFGKATVDNDVDGDGVAVEFNLRQPGQYYDRESGLYYNYFRYYDPETGRYISSDPIGLDGGVNTYTYVENNPLGFIDVFGLNIGDPQEELNRARRNAENESESDESDVRQCVINGNCSSESPPYLIIDDQEEGVSGLIKSLLRKVPQKRVPTHCEDSKNPHCGGNGIRGCNDNSAG